MPPTEMPLNPTVLTPDGAVVNRSYELIEEVGRGAAGVVWRGRATETGREYAIKVLHDLGRDAPKAVARFLQERGILLRLRHENLVAVHDLLTTADGRLALVLDLVTGGSLRELLRQRGTLPPAEAAELLAQVAAGLAAAHGNGVVHRDLKPDNIMIAPRFDGGLRLRLTDFGIAKVLDGPRMTTTGAVLGTPNYMAPEVIEGHSVTPAADVYALGIVLYELLAGRPPFDGDGCDTAILLRHTRAAPRPLAGMPPRMWALIDTCLAKQPTRRPAAATLQTTLRRLAVETAGIAAITPVDRDDELRRTFLLADTSGDWARRMEGAPTPGRAKIAAAAEAALSTTGPSTAGPSTSDPSTSDPSTAGPSTAGPSTTGPSTTGPSTTGSRSSAAGRIRVPRQRVHRIAAALASIVAVTLVVTGYVGTRTSHTERTPGTTAPASAAPAAAQPPASRVERSPAASAPAEPAVALPGQTQPVMTPAASTGTGPDQGAGAGAGEPEELGEWKCRPQQWALAHPVTGKSCYALGDRVRIRGTLQAYAGAQADMQLLVENLGTGGTAAGPFSCPNRAFADAETEQTCGPQTLALPSGRYRVVVRWTYRDSGVMPPGEVVGDEFSP